MKEIQSSESISNRKKMFVNLRLRYACLGLLFFLTNCTVSLAPKFDQGIVDNLSSASAQVFHLLAETSSGTMPAEFPLRAEKYNSLLGTLEALQLQINARPVPDNKTIDKIIAKANERLTKRGISNLTSVGGIAPSATALEQIIINLTKMRDTDQKQGLKPLEVQLFKGNMQLYLDQALTYEKFLNQ